MGVKHDLDEADRLLRQVIDASCTGPRFQMNVICTVRARVDRVCITYTCSSMSHCSTGHEVP